MTDPLSASLAATLRDARLAHDLSAGTLAERSGVSRAMIGKIERGEAQPTAVLLSRLASALGLTLSELIARAEAGSDRRLSRFSAQPTWTDPVTGYVRRAVSPPGPTELVEVSLPAGASVGFPADSYAFADHQIWVLSGHLRFVEGPTVHELDAGDCLHLGRPAPCTYVNPTADACRYLVVLTKR
ncbi:helix-turn-helix domain-containing protein [Amycolatopsis sp. CA-161197]|uniref:helix-turn-helix domain-containing protein n=1 Tax=unclassified Amycolatopsis TaxID=2618356 RepID=UPI0034563869